jgi:hypothetical protein
MISAEARDLFQQKLSLFYFMLIKEASKFKEGLSLRSR